MGWNSIIISVNNENKNLELFINKISIGKLEKMTLARPIVYIGNNANFDEPFGVIADLRIYGL